MPHFGNVNLVCVIGKLAPDIIGAHGRLIQNGIRLDLCEGDGHIQRIRRNAGHRDPEKVGRGWNFKIVFLEILGISPIIVGGEHCHVGGGGVHIIVKLNGIVVVLVGGDAKDKPLTRLYGQRIGDRGEVSVQQLRRAGRSRVAFHAERCGCVFFLEEYQFAGLTLCNDPC